ncbi:MAG: DUF501 domain-containing protein [Acidimicrobiia bacterium]|nr:DUF501 domain-containing protein [Acidimicrobiia bacterium]
MDDRAVVAIQIGRPPRSEVSVEARCHLGLPVVIWVPPLLDDGTPFPTSHWLTCPLATLRVSRLEAEGGVKAADADIAADETLAERWSRTMVRYRTERDDRIPDDWEGAVPGGGVAGSRWGVKCLHAQYADTAAGNENPIGERVALDVEPLDCARPCVIDDEGGPMLNPDWTEP